MADDNSKAGGIGVIVLIVAGLYLWGQCSGGSGGDGGGGDFAASVTDFSAADEVNLRVSFTIENTGTEAAGPECYISARDIAGNIIGSDFLTGDDTIQPGASDSGFIFLTIENEATHRVTDVKIADC